MVSVKGERGAGAVGFQNSRSPSLSTPVSIKCEKITKALKVMLSILVLPMTSALYNQSFIISAMLGRGSHQTENVLCLYYIHHQKSWTFEPALYLRNYPLNTLNNNTVGRAGKKRESRRRIPSIDCSPLRALSSVVLYNTSKKNFSCLIAVEPPTVATLATIKPTTRKYVSDFRQIISLFLFSFSSL